MTTTSTSLLTGYRPRLGVHDEMVTHDGVVREHWRDVTGALELLGPRDLAQRQHEIARQLADDGVSYHVHGRPDSSTRWQLDALPLVVESEEWTRIESGVIQRSELLDLVLADLYGPRDLLQRGLLPPEVVFGHPGFLRAVDGVAVPGPATLVTLAVDLVRDADGGVVVLADRAQSPSGAGYALQNRLVLSRVFPSLYRSLQVHRLAPFFRSLRAALQAAAPAGVDEPRIVILSPGPANETAFEHALLASTLGYSLVEGGDLVAQHGRVWLRTLDQLAPVDVILRRVDAAWCDPLELRGDSQLGVPGLVEAIREGTLAVVNPLGSGVVENPALHAFLPRLATALLGQDLRLPSVRTVWCGESDGLREVTARLDDLVLKPIARGGGPASIVGGNLTAAERSALLARISAHPHRWVGQEYVEVGAVPTFVGGELVPRRSVLRTFAVAREGSFTVMPGGLTRVASDDEPLVANQAGAHSKDTWVLASEPESVAAYWLRPGRSEPVSPTGTMSARAAENLFWLGRYAERAEGLVRLLRVVEERRTDLSSAATADPAGALTLRTLLRTLGQVTGMATLGWDDQPTMLPDDTIRRLMADRSTPGTLAHDLHRLDEAAKVVRDQLSVDTWTVLTALERELDEAPRQRGLADDLLSRGRLGRILTSLLALQGLAAESMIRDPGWRFMDAGRRLERALHVVTLLRTVALDDHGTAADSLLYESVLTASESIVTYRRRYRSRAQLATMLDLLLLDPTNPRSVAHQLDRLTVDLQALPGHPGTGRASAAERPVLDAVTALRLADTARLADLATPDGADRDGAVPSELESLLNTLQQRLRAASDTVGAAHFHHRKPQRGVAIGGVDGSMAEWDGEAT